MLFAIPDLDPRETEVLEEIEELKKKLKWALREPRRWSGSLRRMQFARAVQGSNSIEGFEATLDDAAAIDLGEEPLDADEETRQAVKGYRDAMTYVLQLATDEDFAFTEQLLKSLHFMMTNYDLKIRPGLWRAGSIFVRNDDTGDIVYEGPDVDLVPELMAQLVESLNGADAAPPMIRAGMAHLNLVMIHPFRDGNGRMGRCLQTLVLAREGILTPVFCSIEEYLGRNTQDYYDVLGEVGQGSWHPEHDSHPWIRLILTAHLRQARTLLRRIRETEQLWDRIESVTRETSLPERTLSVLWDAAMGYRVRNATYRAIFEASAEDTISEGVASRDLRKMVEAGLLIPMGEKRAPSTVAAPVSERSARRSSTREILMTAPIRSVQPRWHGRPKHERGGTSPSSSTREPIAEPVLAMPWAGTSTTSPRWWPVSRRQRGTGALSSAVTLLADVPTF